MKTTLASFLEAAEKSRVVPVVSEIFSDNLSPLSIYQSLAEGKPGSFLLESAEQGVWSRFSFIGVEVRGRLIQSQGKPVEWFSNEGLSALPKDLGLDLPTTALEALELVQKSWFTEPILSDIPLTSGLVGTIGWDVIRDLEKLPAGPADDNPFPRISFSMIRDLVVVDHRSASLLFVSNIYVEGQSRDELVALFGAAEARIMEMQFEVGKPRAPYLASVEFEVEPKSTANQRQEDFLASVERARSHVKVGDVFQVVLSQRFQTQISVSALEMYRVLRALNPSPYMYLLNGQDELGEYSVVGSSPESLVTVSGSKITTHPIAGSRPRGKDWETDHSLELGLLADKKETAEHLMLVDLARNDLLKVCKPNSVSVTEFMQVHRFSHIMHLVSTVEGELEAGRTPIDVFRATFPAGTLSGAPKPRALEIITEIEPTARGIYGGVAGYFDFAGNSDLAIAIRTAVIRDGVATVQAGAGIVLDSDAVSEFEETKSKARAPLRAIAAANSATRLTNG
jgi:anthranilate synthase component 1